MRMPGIATVKRVFQVSDDGAAAAFRGRPSTIVEESSVGGLKLPRIEAYGGTNVNASSSPSGVFVRLQGGDGARIGGIPYPTNSVVDVRRGIYEPISGPPGGPLGLTVSAADEVMVRGVDTSGDLVVRAG